MHHEFPRICALALSHNMLRGGELVMRTQKELNNAKQKADNRLQNRTENRTENRAENCGRTKGDMKNDMRLDNSKR